MLLNYCKKILVLIFPVFYGLNVCPGSKAFTTVYLCLGCEIALCGVSVLYCDIQVTCVCLVSIASLLLFSFFTTSLLVNKDYHFLITTTETL